MAPPRLFLEYFGLRSLEDLPAADELRRIVIEKPPAPLTVDPGLATVPPEQLAQTQSDEKPPEESQVSEAAEANSTSDSRTPDQETAGQST